MEDHYGLECDRHCDGELLGLMDATEIPFHEAMKKFRTAQERCGFGDDICFCGKLNAPSEHMCSMRYYIVQSQLDFEKENLPPYPRTAA